MHARAAALGIPAPVRDNSFEQAIEFPQFPTPFCDETAAGAGVVHNAGKRLIELVGQRSGYFSHSRDATQVREFFAVSPYFRFGLFAGGDIHDDAQNQRPFRALDGADPDFDGELGPVFPTGEQFAARAHGPRRRRGMKARAMSWVLTAGFRASKELT
jgi:hypothetical protein